MAPAHRNAAAGRGRHRRSLADGDVTELNPGPGAAAVRGAGPPCGPGTARGVMARTRHARGQLPRRRPHPGRRVSTGRRLVHGAPSGQSNQSS